MVVLVNDLDGDIVVFGCGDVEFFVWFVVEWYDCFRVGFVYDIYIVCYWEYCGIVYYFVVGKSVDFFVFKDVVFGVECCIEVVNIGGSVIGVCIVVEYFGVDIGCLVIDYVV